jgi:hypothetical protein
VSAHRAGALPSRRGTHGYARSRVRGPHHELRRPGPLRARQARAHRERSQVLPPGPGHPGRRGAGAGRRCLRGVPDPQGQDARRPARAGHGRRAAARLRAGRAPGAVQLHPALQDRLPRRVAQAHARAGDAVPDRPEGPRRRRAARAAPARARARAPGRRRGAVDRHRPRHRRAVRQRTDGRAARAADGRWCPAGLRGGGGDRARGGRAPEVRGGPRARGRDPPGGWSQRAGGVVHQGLLRRPGDGRQALLQGQAQPPPARPAAQRSRAVRQRPPCRRA